MKVAFIVDKFPAISETFILDQITGLIDMGHDVRVFAKSGGNEKEVHKEITKYRLRKKTYYFAKVVSRKCICRLKTLALLACSGIKRPLGTYKLLKMLLSHPQGFSHSLCYLTLPFLGQNFDIIHSHFGPLGLWAVNLKRFGIKGKLVTTFHGYDVNMYPLTSAHNVYQELFDKGDLFTANTNFTKEQTVKLGCDGNKIEILPVGLNMEKFAFKPKKFEDSQAVRLLTVGRLVEKKGYQYSIRALSLLVNNGLNIIYTIAGDGPLKSKLQSLTQELKIEDRVIFTGAINRDEVLKLYDEAHIFILPCTTAKNGDKEGQALVLQEAQACGLPVVSTFHNGIPDGVLNGKSGFLIEECDVDGLVEKIYKLIDTPGLVEEMGRAGRKFVEDRYDIKLLNKKLEGLYQQLLRPDI